MRNVGQQHVRKTLSRPKDKVNMTVSFDRASGAIDDAYFQSRFRCFTMLSAEGVM